MIWAVIAFVAIVWLVTAWALDRLARLGDHVDCGLRSVIWLWPIAVPVLVLWDYGERAWSRLRRHRP